MISSPAQRAARLRLAVLPAVLPARLSKAFSLLLLTTAACAPAVLSLLLTVTTRATAESAAPATVSQVVISEFMAAPNDSAGSTSLRDEDGSVTDWIELHNAGTAPADITGWFLTDKPEDLQRWQFPSGTSIPANGFLVVFASGKDRRTAGKALHTNFALDRAGEYLALVDPSGQVVQSFAPTYPYQYTGVAYGPAGNAGAADRYLVPATPGLPRAPQGPVISDVAHQPAEPKVGEALVVHARISAGSSPVTAYLHYRFGFGAEQEIAMSKGDGSTFSASLPAGTQPPGTLIRYYITAAAQDEAYGDLVGSRWPLSCWRRTLYQSEASLPASSFHIWLPAVSVASAAPGADYVRCPEYLGTVVDAAAIEQQSLLPTLHWYVQEDPTYGWEWYRAAYDAHIRAGNPAWSAPDSSTNAVAYYAGRIYDNIVVHLAGSGSKAFSKKSLNFDFNHDDGLFLRGTEIPGFKFDSSKPFTKMHAPSTGWDESYVRQPLAWRAYMLAQVPSPLAFSIRLHLNGKLSSVTTFVEPIHTPFLRRNGLDPDGTLFKAYDNSLQRASSGLPKDSAAGAVQQRPDELDRSLAFGKFINGISPAVHDSPEQRSQAVAYAYDHVNIPELVNYMATRAVLDDFDTLWHNFLLYQDLHVDLEQPDDSTWSGSGEWTLIPWDKDYVFLRLNSIYPQAAQHPFFGAYGVSPTTNGLFDLVLQDPALRAMYLRRLRSVMDLILAADASKSWIDPYAQLLLNRVTAAALSDTEHYTGPSVPSTDFPISPFDPFQLAGKIEQRRRELYDTTPGSFGSLIPAPQTNPVLKFGRAVVAGTLEQSAITLVNCNAEAIDASDWLLRSGDGSTYQIRPGVVIPGNGGRLYITPDADAFRDHQRQQHGTAQVGLFVQGGLDTHLIGDLKNGSIMPAALTLLDGTRPVATNQAPLQACP